MAAVGTSAATICVAAGAGDEAGAGTGALTVIEYARGTAGPSEAVAVKTIVEDEAAFGAVPVQVTTAEISATGNGQVSQAGRPSEDSATVLPAGASAPRTSVKASPKSTTNAAPSACAPAWNVGRS